MRRGEIWWADLGPAVGSASAKRRPVLVVQADSFNKSRISTVIAAVITSNLRLEEAPGNLALPRKTSQLPRDSVVNVSQIVTIDKQTLSTRLSVIDAASMDTVDSGLRLVLGL